MDRSKGKKVVKSRWVLRLKTDVDGKVEKYKARVVAKGYSHVMTLEIVKGKTPL